MTFIMRIKLNHMALTLIRHNAEKIVIAWTDGHLLAAWIGLWLIVFGLLAAFSDAIRVWPLQWQDRIQARQRAAAQRAQDRYLWAAAVRPCRAICNTRPIDRQTTRRTPIPGLLRHGRHARAAR